MRFGESFPTGADPRSRLNALKIKEGRADVPEYVKFSLAIREKFQERIDRESWPELPVPENLEGAEGIFAAAKTEVDKTWREAIARIITEKAGQWEKNLAPDIPETKAARELLRNPEELERDFSLRQFGVLEVLRESVPAAWRTLIMTSSERQLAGLALMEHWLKHAAPKDLASVCEKIGLKAEELNLFVDTAAILGKYVDHA